MISSVLLWFYPDNYHLLSLALKEGLFLIRLYFQPLCFVVWLPTLINSVTTFRSKGEVLKYPVFKIILKNLVFLLVTFQCLLLLVLRKYYQRLFLHAFIQLHSIFYTQHLLRLTAHFKFGKTKTYKLEPTINQKWWMCVFS